VPPPAAGAALDRLEPAASDARTSLPFILEPAAPDVRTPPPFILEPAAPDVRTPLPFILEPAHNPAPSVSQTAGPLRSVSGQSPE
jgi:hypothetical protein